MDERESKRCNQSNQQGTKIKKALQCTEYGVPVLVLVLELVLWDAAPLQGAGTSCRAWAGLG
jgi:hypothetical protein